MIENANETIQEATNCVQPRSRSNEELLCELTREYCFVSNNLRKLGNAIKADPESVSEKHKELWKLQAEHMSHYNEVLALRIKDVLDNNN